MKAIYKLILVIGICFSGLNCENSARHDIKPDPNETACTQDSDCTARSRGACVAGGTCQYLVGCLGDEECQQGEKCKSFPNGDMECVPINQ